MISIVLYILSVSAVVGIYSALRSTEIVIDMYSLSLNFTMNDICDFKS